MDLMVKNCFLSLIEGYEKYAVRSGRSCWRESNIHIIPIFFLFFFPLGIISYVAVTVAKQFACIIVLNPYYKSTRHELSNLHFRNEATEAYL